MYLLKLIEKIFNDIVNILYFKKRIILIIGIKGYFYNIIFGIN